MNKPIINHKTISADIPSILLRLRGALGDGGRLKDIRGRGSNILTTCPVHKDGKEEHPSCMVYCGENDEMEWGTWHCFACEGRGKLVDFVGKCFEKDSRFGSAWLEENFCDTYVEDLMSLPEIVLNQRKAKTYIPLDESVLTAFEPWHPYMAKRKITPEVAQSFEVKYNPILDSIVFPVRNECGELITLTQRCVNVKQFYIDKDIEKPVYLFNRILNHPEYPFVIITEAQIDALTCWGWGVPAVAFIGLGSNHQYEILNKNRVKCWVTLFDNDSAGRSATRRFNTMIRKDEFVINLTVPSPKKDINNLTEDELNCLLGTVGLNWRLPVVD